MGNQFANLSTSCNTSMKLRNIEESTTNADKVQEGVFVEIKLKRNEETEYFPVVTYEDPHPEIQRIADGDAEAEEDPIRDSEIQIKVDGDQPRIHSSHQSPTSMQGQEPSTKKKKRILFIFLIFICGIIGTIAMVRYALPHSPTNNTSNRNTTGNAAEGMRKALDVSRQLSGNSLPQSV